MEIKSKKMIHWGYSSNGDKVMGQEIVLSSTYGDFVLRRSLPGRWSVEEWPSTIDEKRDILEMDSPIRVEIEQTAGVKLGFAMKEIFIKGEGYVRCTYYA